MRTSVQPGSRGRKGLSHDDRDGAPSEKLPAPPQLHARIGGGRERGEGGGLPSLPGVPAQLHERTAPRPVFVLAVRGRLPPHWCVGATRAVLGLNPPR